MRLGYPQKSNGKVLTTHEGDSGGGIVGRAPESSSQTGGLSGESLSHRSKRPLLESEGRMSKEEAF